MEYQQGNDMTWEIAKEEKNLQSSFEVLFFWKIFIFFSDSIEKILAYKRKI